MMRLFIRLASLLFIVLVCLPLAAQDTTTVFPNLSNRRAKYSISGTLRDAADNREMHDVRVDLYAIGGQNIATAFTSSNGGFVFSNITVGDYSLAVKETGYEPVNESVTVEAVEGSVFSVEISLHRSKAAPESSDPSISARELSIPQKAHNFMKKGLSLLYEKADFRRSISQFQSAIKEYPDYYEAYAQMGGAYTGLGDAADAEQALRKSIDLSGQRYGEAYLMLATLYSNGKRFADAEPLARKGSTLDGNSWQGHYELARALYGLGRYAEAESQGQNAEQLQPDRAEIRLLLANVHLRLRKYPLALEDVSAYLRLEPDGPTSDQVRHLRDQVQEALEKAQAPAAAPSSGADSPSSDNHQGPDPK